MNSQAFVKIADQNALIVKDHCGYLIVCGPVSVSFQSEDVQIGERLITIGNVTLHDVSTETKDQIRELITVQ